MSLELMNHPDRHKYDLSSLKDITAGGAPRPVSHVKRLGRNSRTPSRHWATGSPKPTRSVASTSGAIMPTSPARPAGRESVRRGGNSRRGGPSPSTGETGEIANPHRRKHQMLLAQPESDGGAIHRRRFRPHRRRRLSRRGRISVHRRPQEGDHHPRRREYLRCRGRGGMLRLSRRRRSLGVRRRPTSGSAKCRSPSSSQRTARSSTRTTFAPSSTAGSRSSRSPNGSSSLTRHCRVSAPARSTAAPSRLSTRVEPRPSHSADRRRSGRRPGRRIRSVAARTVAASSCPKKASRRSAISSRSPATGGSRSPFLKSRRAKASGPRCHRSLPMSSAPRGTLSPSSRRR